MRFWFSAMGLAAVLVSCVVPGGEGGKSTVPRDQGVLVIDWRPDLSDRAQLGSSWAQATADAYELVLAGTAGFKTVDLTSGPGQTVAVDPGTWRVVVLAGVKRSSGSSTAYLVGSAGADGVVVSAGQRTPVSLVLRSLDLGLHAVGQASWKGPVTMAATGKSRNPWVGMLLAGASTTSRPRLKSTELWGGYREMASVTGTPDDWAAEATGTVPDACSSFTVGLVGAGLCIQGTDGVWVPTAGWTKLTWSWPSRADLADTHPLAPATEVVVPAGPPPTGVEVSVTWE